MKNDICKSSNIACRVPDPKRDPLTLDAHRFRTVPEDSPANADFPAPRASEPFQ